MKLTLLFVVVASASAHSTNRKSDDYLRDLFPYNADTELALYSMERDQLRRLQRVLRERKIHIGGFYHVGPSYNFWNHVIKDQLKLIDGCLVVPKPNATHGQVVNGATDSLRSNGGDGSPVGLMDLTDHLFIGLHGEVSSRTRQEAFIRSLELSFKDRISFEHRNAVGRKQWAQLQGSPEKQAELRASAERMNPVATEGEFHTVDALHSYCKKAVAANKTALVFYFHTKTANQGKQMGPGACWRDIMNAYTIEFSSICLRALLKGYSSCGPLLSANIYAGNFWWASCNHVAFLPGLWDPIDNAYDAETFIHNVSMDWGGARQWFKNFCAYGNYATKIDLYKQRVVRGSYLKDLYTMLAKEDLPPSLGRVSFQRPGDLLFHGEPCYSVNSDLSKNYAYKDHAYFQSPSKPRPYSYESVMFGTTA